MKANKQHDKVTEFSRGIKNFTLPLHSSDGFEIYDLKGNKFVSVSGRANGRTANSVVKAVNEHAALEAVSVAAEAYHDEWKRRYIQDELETKSITPIERRPKKFQAMHAALTNLAACRAQKQES